MKLDDKLFSVEMVLLISAVITPWLIPKPFNYILWGLMFGSGITIFFIRRLLNNGNATKSQNPSQAQSGENRP